MSTSHEQHSQAPSIDLETVTLDLIDSVTVSDSDGITMKSNQINDNNIIVSTQLKPKQKSKRRKSSIQIAHVLDSIAKESKTSDNTLPTFQDLTYFVKLASDKVFNDNDIANIIYNTINFGDFEDRDDVFDDIYDCNHSHILLEIEEIINNDDTILYEWTQDDSNQLYEILIKVYEEYTTDHNVFNKFNKNSGNQTKYNNDIFQRNSWKKGTNCEIYCKIQNKWCKGQIVIDNGEWISVQYSMKSIRIRRYDMYIRSVFMDSKNEKRDQIVYKSIRDNWKMNTTCKIYLQTLNKWMHAEIIKILDHEWLLIKCMDNTLRKVKKYSRFIRPTQQNMFEENGKQSLINELRDVIDVLNYEIQRCEESAFLYQIYTHDLSTLTIHKCVTYDTQMAMKYYKEIIRNNDSNTHTIIMYCNGKRIRYYGNNNYYFDDTEAKKNYKVIIESLHTKLLNKNDIISSWREADHDERWLLSTKSENVIAFLTTQLGIPTIQIAETVYEKLKFIKFDTDQSTSLQLETVAIETNEVMFLWAQRNLDIKSLDHNHFLFVASLVLDKYNIDIDK
eukprot:370554_1